jgi:Ser-tRNA(Ala) deacylase AlaX
MLKGRQPPENRLVHFAAVNTPAYERDAYLRELDTEVTATGEVEGRPWAATADTLFYPEGGGQPADRGTMNGIAVLDVQSVEGLIRHTLSSPLACGPVRQVLDWTRRFDHMQQHTAQHLLTAVALGRFGWRTTAFHLGPVQSDIELDVPALAVGELRRLEDAINEHCREARPVSVRFAGREQLEELGVRSRLLPAGLEGELRLVEIEGLDLNTCGGTHLRSTAEIGAVALIGTEPMRGGTRLYFVAGDRLRRRLAVHEARNLELRGLLGASDDELPQVVALRIEREKAIARDGRRLLEELAAATAEALAARPEQVVAAHWPERDMAFLQALGKALIASRPERVALLAAGPPSAGVFVVVAGEASGLDLAAAGAEVARLLGGRGGGRAPFWQGKATTLDCLDEAAAALRRGLKAEGRGESRPDEV